MKIWIVLFFLLSSPLIAQTTARLKFNLPAQATPSSDVINNNFSRLDDLLSGNSPLPGLKVAHPGVFTKEQVNLYTQSLLGNIRPENEIHPAYTTALIGAVAVPESATALNVMGVTGVADSTCNTAGETKCDAVAGYFQGRASANGASVWGLNPLVNDAVGISGTNLTGTEIDINVLGTPLQVYGLQITGVTTGTMPAESYGIIINPRNNPFHNGILIANGAVGGGAAYWVPALAKSGTNVRSAPIGWNFFDSSGKNRISAQFVDSQSLMNIAYGIKIDSAPPTCTFNNGGGAGASCALDAGSSNMNGTIIAVPGFGASGTGAITLTFNTSFSTFGPDKPVCIYQASDGGGGVWDGLATFKDNSPSNTRDVFTWNNGVATTPLSARTAYWINYHCWPK